MTPPLSVRQGRMRGDEGALQKIKKVLLGRPTSEGLGYVPVNEKCLQDKECKENC